MLPHIHVVHVADCAHNFVHVHVKRNVPMMSSECTSSRSSTEWIHPTSVRDRFWLYVDGPAHLHDCLSDCYGKWVVTQPLEHIDKTWHLVGDAVQDGRLEALQAKCSTLCYNPDCFGPGPVNIASICVYTSEKSVDGIGFKLIELVQHDIYYKTDQATLSGVYEHTASKKLTSIFKTLYWNNGEPSFELKGTPKPGWTQIQNSSDFKDSWQLNRVKGAPEVVECEKVHGKWVVYLDYGEVTEFWHRLKDRVESGELGVVEMVCPAKVSLHDPSEKPRLYLFTSEKMKDEVGSKLVCIFKTDLVYERETET